MITERTHPLAILEAALDQGRVPEKMREQYHKQMSVALHLERGAVLEHARMSMDCPLCMDTGVRERVA